MAMPRRGPGRRSPIATPSQTRSRTVTPSGVRRRARSGSPRAPSLLPPSSPPPDSPSEAGGPSAIPDVPIIEVEFCKDSRTGNKELAGQLPCPGVLVRWHVGSIWETYPYALHALRDVGWIPISLGSQDNTLRLRSEHCQHPDGGSSGWSCPACISLPSSAKFKTFLSHASEAKAHTPWNYLTDKQKVALMKKMNLQLRQLRRQVASARRQSATAARRIADYQRIMIMLATHDFASLRQLLSVALRHGASPTAVLSQLQRALDGLYSPRGGYTEEDIDIAFIAKSLGGPRLLYALQKGRGFASERTVRRQRPVPKLLASVGTPNSGDTKSNIGAFCNPDFKPPPKSYKNESHNSKPAILPGNVLMFDGVALEGRCRYCPRRDVVLGFCREHGSQVSMSCKTIEAIQELKQKVDRGELCFGSDATVVAIAPYTQTDHYTPVPLILSASDKTEKGEQLGSWVQKVLDSWAEHEHGAQLHGPIWAIASDGDSSFRLAKHLLCMTIELDKTSPLGQKLAGLPGLNLYTSRTGITGTCDPKHIFKRFGTLLRSPRGITIFGDTITAAHIHAQLCELPGMTREKASQLLDPADKQNVPKAVSLIQHLLLVRDLPESSTPSMARHQKSINFLATMMGYFLLPFISIDMSLSEQVQSLSTYAHLAAATYRKHGTACLTGALYHDTQAVVKNIIFNIARTQLIDNELPLPIILEGTDRLEQLFADCRTQDHARNFDIDELSTKLSIATTLNATFQRNPHLDKGHRRLSLKDAMGIDHVNPRSWEGDMRVGGVNLQTMWANGHAAANKLVDQYFPAQDAAIDTTIFQVHGVDLMRPLGKYVGVDAVEDDIRSERMEDSQTYAVPTEEGVEELGLNIDDFFESTPEETQHGHTSPLNHVLVHEGKTYYKSSLVASLCSNRAKKVTMRTLRARGISLEDLQRESIYVDQHNLLTEDLIKSGDLAAVLCRTGNSLSLAVIEMAGFLIGSNPTMQSSVAADKFFDSQGDITVRAQILQLDHTSQSSWIWNSEYLLLQKQLPGKTVTQRHLVLEVPSSLVFPLAPAVAAVPCSRNQVLPQGKPKITWSLDEKQLSEVFTAAYDALDPDTEEAVVNVAQLPHVDPIQGLPYQNASGIEESISMFAVLLTLQNTRLSTMDCL